MTYVSCLFTVILYRDIILSAKIYSLFYPFVSVIRYSKNMLETDYFRTAFLKIHTKCKLGWFLAGGSNIILIDFKATSTLLVASQAKI